MKCKFVHAYAGACTNEADESGYCHEHKDVKCCSCGEKATHTCNATFGLVCGEPLCDNCEHTLDENGVNAFGSLPDGMKSHCKKSEQKYESWIVIEWKNEVKKMKVTKIPFNSYSIEIGFSNYTAELDYHTGLIYIYDRNHKIVSDSCGDDIRNELEKRIHENSLK